MSNKKKNNKQNKVMREKSGNVNSDVPLVSFLYELMRDHLPVGIVEEIIRNSTDKTPENEKMVYQFTNGWLAQIAINMAERLK